MYVLSEEGVEVTPVDIHPAELAKMETYEVRFPFGGKNHGKKFTEIPQRDLRRYAGRKTKWGHLAQRELDRRGTNYVDDPVELSYHSIDRASQICLDLFVNRPDKSVGLKTWLVKLAADALAWKNVDNGGRYCHMGLKFYFDFRPQTPVLVTIVDNRDPGKKRVVIAPPNEG